MPLVSVKTGLADRSQLIATDIVTEDGNSRVVATEWHCNGELVRRDVWVNSFRGLEMNGKAA